MGWTALIPVSQNNQKETARNEHQHDWPRHGKDRVPDPRRGRCRKGSDPRKIRRSDLVAFFEKQEACMVVMEACGAAHHWGRTLTGLGHNVKLIAPEAVKPFMKKGKKNDAATRQQSASRRSALR